MNIEVGKEYVCKSQRKGTFRMLVTQADETWVTGEVTDGVAQAMLRENVRDTGESVTVRRSLCTFENI